MADNAWIFVADRETWPDCVSEGSFGLETKPGRIKEAKEEDPCLAYVTRECVFAGFGKITSSYYYDESAIWADGTFPHRLGIELNLDLDRTVDIRPLVNNLDFITDKKHWPVFLRGGVAKISLADFNLVKSSIERQWLTPPKAEEITKIVTPGVRETILGLPELSGTFHNRLAEMIHLIGLEMGYDSVQRFKTHPDSPYQIDVAWLQKKNPHIAVEVHDAGNIVEALERLRHARDFNFRKVILVIVDPNDLRRCLDILRFDEKLKHWIDLWAIESIYKMYTNCMAFKALYQRFEESTYKDEMQDHLF